MGKTNGPSGTAGKVFTADVVAALLMSFNVTSITMKQYDLMSAMDGTKTASAFQHDFRSVLAKARELKARSDAGETFEAVAPGKKRGAGIAAVTPPDTPAKKTKASPQDTPKKPRAAPKGRGKKAAKEEANGEVKGDVKPAASGMFLGLPDYFGSFDAAFKQDLVWE